MAPTVFQHPEARTMKEGFMIDPSVERGTAPRTLEGTSNQDTLTRRRGVCAGCGSTERALIAPRKNLRGYTGPMHCLTCTPRFSGEGLAIIDRLGG